jgi:predicted AAA+ superfamily ATPase
MRGNIFEAMILADFRKQQLNRSLRPSCYYWRDKTHFEIDCIVEHDGIVVPIEIKASKTADIQALEKLAPWNKLTKTNQANNILIYGGDDDWSINKGRIVSWHSAGSLFEK